MKAQGAPPTTRKPLSIVHDTNNHTIHRHPYNVLIILPTTGRTPIPHAEAQAVADWYWSRVALKDDAPGTSPQTHDDGQGL